MVVLNKLSISIIVILVLTGGVVYFLFGRSSKYQDPKLLLGWWQNVSANPSPNSFSYIEFKEGQICVDYTRSFQGQVSCTRYLPYTVKGDVVMMDDNPFYKWRVEGETLEVWARGTEPKETYTKMK